MDHGARNGVQLSAANVHVRDAHGDVSAYAYLVGHTDGQGKASACKSYVSDSHVELSWKSGSRVCESDLTCRGGGSRC